jgi:Polyphosphate kinase 2 (PPK2)
VLAVRVHPENPDRERIPPESRREDIWKHHYRAINDWERYLTENGIRLVKLFLNVSKEEQRIRFLKRIDRPEKNWKFSAADVRERRYWDQYQHAYSAMLTHTSTEWAPWYVLPADHKWFTRICAAAVIVQTLIELDPQYPVPGEAARGPRGPRHPCLEAVGAGAGQKPDVEAGEQHAEEQAHVRGDVAGRQAGRRHAARFRDDRAQPHLRRGAQRRAGEADRRPDHRVQAVPPAQDGTDRSQRQFLAPAECS